MKNYFYKIENKINGKFYYGVHKTSNLDDDYMGSGIRIRRSIKKYGKENFNKIILLFFDTYDEAFDYEIEFVNESLLIDPSCYNLKKGGYGGWDLVNKIQNNEWRKKTGYNAGIKHGGYNKLTQQKINERFFLIKDIDLNKFGWVSKVSKVLNISHTQTKRFIKKYYKGNYFER